MIKSIKHIGAFALVGLTLASCNKYLDEVAVSPNSAVASTPQALTTGIEVSTFATVSGQLARQSAIMTQQITGTDFQLADINRYIITELTNGNEWDNIYSRAMKNSEIVINDFGEENPRYRGIAKVMQAVNLGIATDFWNDIPYSDAFKAEDGNFSPSYDAQESVLNSIQTLLDEAISDLGTPAEDNTNIPGGDDLIYNGNMDMWAKAAYALKMRYANRLSERDPMGSAAEVLSIAADALAAGANMTSSGDNFNANFGPNGNEQNQWYAFEQSRGGYMQMSENYIELLKAINDPRLVGFATQVDTNTVENDPPDLVYIGTPITSADQSTSKVGPFLASPTAPVSIISYSESLFILAEANLRAGNAPEAAELHNMAIMASVLNVAGEEAPQAYIDDQASEDAGSITIEKIMTHKYVAGFGQIEAYADWRRTGIPALTPNPNGVQSTIPLRLPTPQDERLLNSNATVVSNINSPVWWDAN